MRFLNVMTLRTRVRVVDPCGSVLRVAPQGHNPFNQVVPADAPAARPGSGLRNGLHHVEKPGESCDGSLTRRVWTPGNGRLSARTWNGCGVLDGFDTERLRLRALTLDDVDLLVALDSDPEVMRYINGGRPTPRAETEAVVRRSLDHRWLAFERSTGAFVGWFGLRPSGTARERELGYRLRQETWGNGYATEGSRALIVAAF
ncbi:MAG: hypothetical protein QOI55_771, partial [Actinomycetota bacterium]|nr:hypothetical protein [Actinomycetota bacterium]